MLIACCLLLVACVTYNARIAIINVLTLLIKFFTRLLWHSVKSAGNDSKNGTICWTVSDLFQNWTASKLAISLEGLI